MKKPYRPPRELLQEIDRILARRYSPTDPSPLEKTAELLHEGRHYSWTRIYLLLGEEMERQVCFGPESVAETKAELEQPIKLAGRVLGMILVDSDRLDAFPQGDRVLVKEIAGRLARFLTGRGKYLVRRAREAAAAARSAAASTDSERRRPASERGESRKVASS